MLYSRRKITCVDHGEQWIQSNNNRVDNFRFGFQGSKVPGGALLRRQVTVSVTNIVRSLVLPLTFRLSPWEAGAP